MDTEGTNVEPCQKGEHEWEISHDNPKWRICQLCGKEKPVNPCPKGEHEWEVSHSNPRWRICQLCGKTKPNPLPRRVRFHDDGPIVVRPEPVTTVVRVVEEDSDRARKKVRSEKSTGSSTPKRKRRKRKTARKVMRRYR